MEFLVMGRYPLRRVRTMPAKYSFLGELNFTWQDTNPPCKEWTVKLGLLHHKLQYSCHPHFVAKTQENALL